VAALAALLSLAHFRLGASAQRHAPDSSTPSPASLVVVARARRLSEAGQQIRRIADSQARPLLLRLSLYANTGAAESANFEPAVEGGEDASLSVVLARLDMKIRRRVTNRDLADSLVESIREIDLRGVSAQVLGTGVGFIKYLLLVVIYMLFIFAEQAVFRRKILSVAGRRRSETERALDRISHGVQRYLGVKTISSLVTGALCYLGLRSLDMDHAELFGLLTFLLNYIPTFGSIIAGVIATVTALALSDTWHTGAGVAIVYLSVNLVIGSYLEPKILGRELNLSPLVVVISVVVWAGLWGPVGTFLAVPMTSAMQIILASHKNTRPIAVLLSSGPPKEAGRKRRRKRPRATETGADDAPPGAPLGGSDAASVHGKRERA
jgi:hypothetical protein